jgi:hypothetical protein
MSVSLFNLLASRVFVSADSGMREMREQSAVVRVRGKHCPYSPRMRRCGNAAQAAPISASSAQYPKGRDSSLASVCEC